MKTCAKCGRAVEPIYERYGRRCRKCRGEEATARNRANPARAREAGARYRAKHPARHNASVREANWKKQGITFSMTEFETMLAAQGGGCAICGTKTPGHPGAFHVDHDHCFGHVRGLLCNRCNRALGSFKDSPGLLMAAVKYLGKHQPRLAI